MKALIATAAALLLSAAPAASQPKTNVLPVRLYSYGYVPAPLSLHAGVEVTMVFTNGAGKGHEFKAPEFFHAARIVSGEVSEEGSVELAPHQSMSISLVPARGTYPVHCGHFMHSEMGMKSTIYVQ
jgi:plastocyanin